MPSTRDNSAGPPPAASPRLLTAENAGLEALIAESEAAVERLLASSEWAAQQAAVHELAGEIAAAPGHHLHEQEIVLMTGTLPVVASLPGVSMTMHRPVPNGIHSSDLVRLLQAEGLEAAKPWTLRHAVKRGRIPSPFKTASGDHAWRAADLPAIRRYMRNPVRPGRPRKGT